jgi:hypothetical protein
METAVWAVAAMAIGALVTRSITSARVMDCATKPENYGSARI